MNGARPCRLQPSISASERALTADARKYVVFEISRRVEQSRDKERIMALRTLTDDVDWKVAIGHHVVVDLSRFVMDAMAKAREVDVAAHLVTEDLQVMGGQPCFAGTRVPIDVVLGSLDKGIAKDRVIASYPFLTEAHIDAARVYQLVHPRRGRPRRLGDTHPPRLRRVSRVVRPADA